MSAYQINGYDNWLDQPFQRDMDERAAEPFQVVPDCTSCETTKVEVCGSCGFCSECCECDEAQRDFEHEDDGGPRYRRVPCSMCGKPTTFDPTYEDLCYRCCRADNE